MRHALLAFTMAAAATSSGTFAQTDSRTEVELSLTMRSFAPAKCGDPATIERLYPKVLSTRPFIFESTCEMEGTDHTIQSSVIEPHPSFEAPIVFEFGFPPLENITTDELDMSHPSGVPKPRYCSDVLSTDNITVAAGFCGGYVDPAGQYEFFASTGKDNFDKWYQDTRNVNLRSSSSIKLVRNEDNIFEYDSSKSSPEALAVDGSILGFFGPLDDIPPSLNPYELNARWPLTEIEENVLNNEGSGFALPHKFWFTTEIHTFFQYEGNETFTFDGDDDVFIFVNGHKEIDLSGVHSAVSRSFNTDELKQGPLVLGKVYSLDMFHAERQTTQSNFKIQTTLTASCTVQNTPVNDTATVEIDDFDDDMDAWYLANAEIDDGFLVMVASYEDTNTWSHAWLKQEISVLRGFTVDFTYVLYGNNTVAEGHSDGLVLAVQSSGIDDLQGGVSGNFGIRGLNGVFFIIDLCDNRGGGLNGPRPGVGDACVDQTVFKLQVNDEVVAREPVYARIADGEEHTVSFRYYARPNWVDVYHDGSLWLRATDLNLNETLGGGRAHVGFSSSTSELATRTEITSFRASSVKVSSDKTRISSLPGFSMSMFDDEYEYDDEIEPIADGLDKLSIEVLTFDFCDGQVDFGGLGYKIQASLIAEEGDNESVTGRRRRLEGDGVIAADVIDNLDGTYSVQFVTNEPGSYTLVMTFDDIPVCLSGPGDTLQCSPFVGAASFLKAVPLFSGPPSPAPTSAIFVDRRPGLPSGLVYGIGAGAAIMMCWACLFMLLGRKDKKKWNTMSPYVEKGRNAGMEDGVEFAGEAQLHELTAELLRTKEEINRWKARRGPRSSITKGLEDLEKQSAELAASIKEIKLAQQMRDDDSSFYGSTPSDVGLAPVPRPKMTWRERVASSSSNAMLRLSTGHRGLNVGVPPQPDANNSPPPPPSHGKRSSTLSHEMRLSHSSGNDRLSGSDGSIPAPPPEENSSSNIDV